MNFPPSKQKQQQQGGKKRILVEQHKNNKKYTQHNAYVNIIICIHYVITVYTYLVPCSFLILSFIRAYSIIMTIEEKNEQANE